ncbi:MAG: outer membrane lipoprotein-sorting protein [Thiomicrospira sp.]|uniref:outer membrane lipoprotein-sorting protein n=1 Tax=Thiomicrospira sp. TaxID=935 RepID=UPI0019FA5E95|nr:outer membrane lipoprotein-sorting protein [Thiomicrospira sp.]MBE0492869.1 outer membrane lipoprotein-sorting protein [Thiomicrospira sp.]
MRIALISLTLSLIPGLVVGQSKTAAEIIEASLNLWRGDTSYSVTEMTIHRPAWQRDMRLEGWSRGMKDSLIRFIYPPRDTDNATLKLDNEMWIFTPKLNRVTKLPASMMTQSWMGSDFSYNDLARSDQTLENYNHRLIETRQQDGHMVYIIEAVPKPNAPVVWGKEVAKIRGDYVILENVFYDQSMQEVKRLQTLKIENIDGRPFPTVMRITNADKPEHWTEIRTSEILINIDLPDYLFTLANLQRPRPWKP